MELPEVAGFPVVPVAVAALVGFSLGLALSIVMDARRPVVPAAEIPLKRPCNCNEVALDPSIYNVPSATEPLYPSAGSDD